MCFVKYNHRSFMQFVAFFAMGIATASAFLGYAYLRERDIVSKEDPSTFGICVLFAQAFVEMAKKIWRIDKAGKEVD